MKGIRFIFLLLVFAATTQMQALAEELHWALRLFKLGIAPMTTIMPANAQGREVNDLYELLIYISLAIFVIVSAIFIYISIAFYHKKRDKPQEIHGSALMESVWTAIPVIILIIIAIPTVKLIFKIGTIPDLTAKTELTYYYPDEEDPSKRVQVYKRYLEVNVIAHQWWWEFEYLGYYFRIDGEKEEQFEKIPKITANEFWLPTNIPIKMNLISEDVIHSFWIPRLGGKLDVLPGQDNKMSFIIEEEGIYEGQCTEYCGASHALMRMQVRAVSMEKFTKWTKWGNGELVVKSESALRGQEAFNACIGCHTLDGVRPYEDRQERIEEDLEEFESDMEDYREELAEFQELVKTKYPDLHPRDLREVDEYPEVPEKPHLYQGIYKTIAPDLTDLRFRGKILSGIQVNTRENLKAWIKNPASIKPEIAGTVVTRMNAFEGMFPDETIDDIIEFLMTVEYTDSVTPEEL